MYWTLELASKLEDAPWPATKEELIDYAIRSGAPLEVIENLQEIEDDMDKAMQQHAATTKGLISFYDERGELQLSVAKENLLYIESADKATIVLAAGSVNTLTDATLYQFANPAEDKPNACIYSSDDMTIKGTGTLNVNGNYNNGIGCKNDLRIKDCTLNVTGVNNILKGNDSVEIENATVKLSGGEDAIKSDTADRTDKGYILITAGSKVEINCIDDAIQATMSITIEAGCAITGTCGGDVLNCPGTINADEGAMQIGSTAQPEA